MPLESSIAQIVVLFSIIAILRNVVEQRGMYQNNPNKITYIKNSQFIWEEHWLLNYIILLILVLVILY